MQNEKLERENRSLQAKTDGLFAEKRQLETQLLSHEPYTPSPTEPSVGSLTLVGNNEKLLESGSAVPLTSLQQKQILKVLFARVMVTVRYV